MPCCEITVVKQTLFRQRRSELTFWMTIFDQ
jgi:hypothetical protein